MMVTQKPGLVQLKSVFFSHPPAAISKGSFPENNLHGHGTIAQDAGASAAARGVAVLRRLAGRAAAATLFLPARSGCLRRAGAPAPPARLGPVPPPARPRAGCRGCVSGHVPGPGSEG